MIITDPSVNRKLDEIIARLRAIQGQEMGIMTTVKDTQQFIVDLNDETNALSVKLDGNTATINALKAQVAAGVPVSQEQLDAINAGLAPISARLKALGSDPTDPIPAPVPTPIPTPA